MVIANIYLDNVYAFKDFSMSFVYPKKIVNTPLDNEYFQDYPNFRYKKLNILIGSNATGKTSLGKAIWHLCLFLKTKESKHLLDFICDNNKPTKIVFDYAVKEGFLNRADILINPVDDEGQQKVLMRFYKEKLLKTDSYESARSRFDLKLEYEDYLLSLKDEELRGWNFSFPLTEANCDFFNCPFEKNEQETFRKILLPIITTMDPSIKDIIVSKEVDKTYVVVPESGEKFYISNGDKLSSIEKLSSGTKYGFNIASLVYSIKTHKNGFYYVDEQFSYSNSEIEIAILNLMVSLLGDGEQLFFTSHNVELLSLNYPIHTFTFLRKVKKDNGMHIETINASSLEKRNNVNIKNLYDNDYFGVYPCLDKIFALGE